MLCLELLKHICSEKVLIKKIKTFSAQAEKKREEESSNASFKENKL